MIVSAVRSSIPVEANPAMPLIPEGIPIGIPIRRHRGEGSRVVPHCDQAGAPQCHGRRLTHPVDNQVLDVWG